MSYYQKIKETAYVFQEKKHLLDVCWHLTWHIIAIVHNN